MNHTVIATEPPVLRKHIGMYAGLAAALLMISFSLIHLFRIDTFVPELGYAIPVGQGIVGPLAFVILIAEVFSIPFLLRMKLSPLARLCSGIFVVIVPLAWLLVAIWNYGYPVSTAQLGEFYPLPSSWSLIVGNGVWLLFNLWTLWTMGFGTHKKLSK